MTIRAYQPSDCKSLARLFYDTVHRVNARDYTQEQLCVWATGMVDLDQWNRSFLAHDTVVAVQNGEIVGFGDMDETGTDCTCIRTTKVRALHLQFARDWSRLSR